MKYLRPLFWFSMIVGSVYVVGRIYHLRNDSHMMWSIAAASVFSSFLFISLLIYGAAIRNAARTLKGVNVAFPVAAIVSLAVLSILIAQPDSSPPTTAASSVTQPNSSSPTTAAPSVTIVSNPLASPGVIFVVCLAIVTVVGFVLTVSKLDEIHGRILDYPHLIERCEAVVRLEKERVERRKSGKLYILANTPAFGNVSAEREFSEYREVLNTLLSNDRVEVILASLSWVPDEDGECSHDKFYRAHWPKHPHLEDKIAESARIVNKIGGVISEGMGNKRLYVLRPEIEEVPFHLVLTSERAILFTALSYPERAERDESRSAGIFSDHKERRVQVIGFESGDKAILRALEDGFKARLEHIAQPETRFPHALSQKASAPPPDPGINTTIVGTGPRKIEVMEPKDTRAKDNRERKDEGGTDSTEKVTK